MMVASEFSPLNDILPIFGARFNDSVSLLEEKADRHSKDASNLDTLNLKIVIHRPTRNA